MLPTPCWLLKWKNSLGAGGKPPAWQCGLITEGYEAHTDLDREEGVKEEKKKVVIFIVRQYSMAALEDDRKSFIICQKCLLITRAERRDGSSCWPQPISYIIICLQDLLARLSCSSSIKCNAIPQAFTCSVFHQWRHGYGHSSWNVFRVFCITCTDACSYSSPSVGLSLDHWVPSGSFPVSSPVCPPGLTECQHSLLVCHIHVNISAL